MINGIINLYKEKGFTSFDAVALMRGIAGTRKVGHTGTLDPDAEGVLPICIGNATKLCDMLTDKRKEYVASFLLGVRTDTLDISGEVLEKRTPKVTPEELTKAIRSFVGGYDQVPPMYSAKKVDGHKLYDLARAGKTVERKPQFVEIYDIEILSMELPSVSVRVQCGKGTYIRSLCEDMAKKCGELAVMTGLKRTASGPFKAEDSYRLSDLQILKDEGRLEEAVLPTDSAFPGLKRIVTGEESEKRLLNGNKIPSEFFGEFSFSDGERVLLYTSDNRFAGLYSFSAGEALLIPVKMFLGA